METRTQNSAFKTAKSKENYLITGATGTVGRLIVSELLHRGKCVKALSRNPEKATFPDGVVAIKGDLNDPGSLKDAFQGITGMYLITISGESFEPLEFVVSWYKNTPPEGYTVVPTVEEVTGQPAHTFRQWAKEHRNNFETAK
ncbi:SDR family oxidoreductase [Negadavirga shengliensis]|uniref:SDR family oxidoreductase n=1 Tax=Negadavirga shengliensis TaxID=1389218 RepID=A0ABV9T4S2_9BACT